MFFPGSPLNYPTNSLGAIRRYEANRAPTTFDFKNFNIGDEWLDTSSDDWYKLLSKANNSALWCILCGTGTQAESFIPDSGTSPVVPDVSNQVTFTGNNGITTIGGLNTVTWQLTGTYQGDWSFTCPGSETTWRWDCTQECTLFRGISTGFSGSDWTTCQAGIQTTDATITPIAILTVNDLRAASIRAAITGARADHSAALVGDISYGARRSGGGAIEMSAPIVNIMDDGAASVTIDADVNGNDIRLLVTGEAATTWNWVVTYEYQILNTNA